MDLEEQLQIACAGVSDGNERNGDINNYDYRYDDSDSVVKFVARYEKHLKLNSIWIIMFRQYSLWVSPGHV